MYTTLYMYELEIIKAYKQEWRVDIGRCRIIYYSYTMITVTQAQRLIAQAVASMRYPSWLKVTTPKLHYQEDD